MLYIIIPCGDIKGDEEEGGAGVETVIIVVPAPAYIKKSYNLFSCYVL